MTEPLRFGSVAGYRCLVWRDAPASLSMAVFLRGDGVAGLAARLAALPQVEVFHAHSCFEVHCLGFRADIRPSGWPTLVAHLRIRRNSPQRSSRCRRLAALSTDCRCRGADSSANLGSHSA